ncbi:ester cyclase [Deinococcus oregonensis]|uniref:Ester cyclase n=1 Tax=Deinococcus oregonensis TaxID=1805970 RepID=A0ABV6AY26_9DEIO
MTFPASVRPFARPVIAALLLLTPLSPPAEAGGQAAPPSAASLRPPAAKGTVAYNRWLGETFSRDLLNTRSQEGRVQILNQIVAQDYIQHNPLVNEGRQGLIDFLPVIYQSFPDARFILRDVLATTDRVVTRWTWTGTLTGAPFLGIEANNQKIEFDAIDLWTVRDGMLYEHWDQFDWPRALIQLGVQGLPQPFVDVSKRPYDR